MKLLFVIFAITLINQTTNADYAQTICEMFSLILNCGDKKISIVSVFFGRSEPFTCHDHCALIYGVSNCQNNYLINHNCQSLTADSEIRRRCHGLSSCSLVISNQILGDPCHGTYKYATVTFNCVV